MIASYFDIYREHPTTPGPRMCGTSYSVLQKHRTIGLYDFMKAYFPKQASQSHRTRDERAGAYLFEVSLSAVKRYASMVLSIVN